MNQKNLMLGAALAGLILAGSSINQAVASGTEVAKGECHGVNSCKGKGECGGTGHSCAGKNSCKGKGWVTKTEAECKKLKGQFKAASM